MTRAALAAAVLVLALAVPTAGATPASAAGTALCGSAPPAPAYAHVIVIMDENLSWSQLHGSANAPFINALMSACRTYEAAGATDPSQANYMAATQGAIVGVGGTRTDVCVQCTSPYDNVFHQLGPTGWRAYEESMSKPCSSATTTGSARYKPGHNPAFWYADLKPVSKGGDGSCAVDDIPYTVGDGLGNLPAFSWVTPNVCDDMHWGPSSVCPMPAGVTKPLAARVQQGDAWLESFLTQDVFSRDDYKQGQDLVILTWDEGNEASSTWGLDCADTGTWLRNGSCRVATVLISPSQAGGWVNAPATDAAPSPLYSHYSILRLVQATFGLPVLPEPDPAPAYWGAYAGAPAIPVS